MKKDILVVGEHGEINPRAKTILMDAMHQAGFEESDFRWINVLPEAPPEGKNVTKTMIKNAKERFIAKLEKRDPRYA